jgi:glutaredoxin 3
MDTEAKSTPEIIIYSTPTCHFCHMTKEFLTEHKVEFTDYNVAEDLEKRSEMVERSGQMGVPVIFVGEEMMIGFNEPRLRELLNIEG